MLHLSKQNIPNQPCTKQYLYTTQAHPLPYRKCHATSQSPQPSFITT